MKHTAAAARKRGALIVKVAKSIGEDPCDMSIFMSIECGLHSGFPVCCIEFWVKTYKPIVTIADSLNAHGETFAELLNRASPLQAAAMGAMGHHGKIVELAGLSPGYIPCPRCLVERKLVKVRKCDWHLTARERRGALAYG